MAFLPRRLRVWWRTFRLSTRRPDPERWERSIVLALGASTLLAAAATWIAVTTTSDAQDEDRRAVGQTTMFQSSSLSAELQAGEEYSNAVAYLYAVQEAAAAQRSASDLERQGRAAEAALQRADAGAVLADGGARSELAFDTTYLDPYGLTFQMEKRRDAIRLQGQTALADPQQPEQVAGAADGVHGRASALAWTVCALLLVPFLLTIARVAPARWRPALVVASGTVGGAAVLTAVGVVVF